MPERGGLERWHREGRLTHQTGLTGQAEPTGQARPAQPLARRLLTYLVLALVTGVVLGLALPRLFPEVAQVIGEYRAVGSAAQALAGLRVVDRPHPAKPYNRTAFGYQQTDTDGNGCSIREDILSRDLVPSSLRHTATSTCQVAAGLLNDPYTGRAIDFVRGAKTSSKVQIDHVVALGDAWKSGASGWSTARLYQYGNDPYNLLAVDGPANEDKSDSSAAYWLPPNQSFDCEYVARQIGVKAKYGLSVTSAEKAAMLRTLHGCPGQAVPAKGGYEGQ